MSQKEIFLCKYGEIVLKGANRKYFEDMLCRELKKRAAEYGNFDIYRAQSTIYIEPKDDFCDMDGMFASASKVFGIVAIQRAAVCRKDMEDIFRVAKEYVPQFLEGKRSFKRIAIVANSPDYTAPCGICRQMLYEFAPDLQVLCANGNRAWADVSLRELLPMGFSASSMEK
jgi:thiamine biosynthesis protein ThiI